MHNSSVMFSDILFLTAEYLADVAKHSWGIDHTFPALTAAVPRNQPALIATTVVKLAAGAAGVGGVALLVLTPAAQLGAVGVAVAVAGAVLMAAGVALTNAR